MKKIYLLLFVLLPLFGLAQYNTDTVPSKPASIDYLKKSRNLKAVGWSLIGLGFVGVIVTGAAEMGDAMQDLWGWGSTRQEQGNYSIPYIASGLVMAVGIGCLFEGGRFKRMSNNAAVSLKMESSPTLAAGGRLTHSSYPSLSFRWRL